MNGTLKTAITISPPDRTNKYTRIEDIYRMDRYTLNKRMRTCSKYFMLYPEVDLQGRLHYHGVIKINDPIKWYKSVLPYIKATLGFVLLKPLNTTKDMLKWNIYSSKSWPAMRDIFKLPIYPHKTPRTKYSITNQDLDHGILVYLKDTSM